MKNLKHLFTALLLLCATAATAYEFEKGGIYYNITSTTDFTVEVTEGIPPFIIDGGNFSYEYSGNVVIPESVTYNGSTYSVTSIGFDAFRGCSGLTSVVIPNSVTSIGEQAFDGCSGLTSIEIPNSVTSIGSCAFEGCSGLKEVHISDLSAWCGISFGTYSANPLYYAHNLYLNGELVTDLVIPDGVTEIKGYAFYGCSGLTSVVIPNSVTSIGENAFDDCSGLKEVHISDLSAWCGIDFEGFLANPLYYAHNLYLNGELVTDLVIPDGVTEIKGYAFYFCSGLTSVVIPNSVTSIGVRAFEDCSGLTSVVIPNSVTSIGENAFEGCSGLTSVVIPNSVTSIGVWAFNYCSGLTSVVIPNSVTSIGSYTFYGCSGLTSVVIPNSVTSIGSYAFYGCSGLKKVINCSSLKFSKGAADYGYVAYYAETVIYAPNGVIEGDFVFAVIDGVNTLCGYIGAGGDVTLPAGYKGENYAIGADVFKNNTSLTSVVIPNSVTSIGDGAFSGCTALTSIEILDGVTGIGEEAFRGCSDLGYIYISSTIESIGDYAFAECNNIFDIKIGSKKAVAASENVFSSDAYNNACLYVPAGRKDFYAKTSPWSNFVIQETDFTGIDEVKGENGKVKDVYYDLNGRAVERPANGLYIKNGKKVFVK